MESGFRRFSVRTLFFLLLAAAAILIMAWQPFQNLESLGHMALGCTLLTVGGWIFKPFGLPNSISGLFLLGAMLICGMPAGNVFAGFSQNALWTLIPALFLGLALQKTGLGERITVGLLKIFPCSWAAIICAWVIIGTALSLVTPSMTVRAVIMIPIASQSCRLFGLKPGSRDASFMLLITIFTAIFPGNAFLTGNLTAPIIQGIFDSTRGLEDSITFDTWIRAALLPVAIITVVTVVLAFFFLRPENPLSKEAFLDHISIKGKITREETVTAAVLFVSCALFFTGRYHGISSTAICIMAAVILFAAGVVKPEEFAKGINWDLVFFFGSGLCMSAIFQASGVSDWLAGILSGLILPIVRTPFVFVLVVSAVLFIWRFVDVTTLIPTTVILAPVISRITVETGISPSVWGVILAVVSISMFLTYTNMWTAMGKGMVGDYAWSEGQLFRFGSAFFLAAMIGLLASVPYWMGAGLL